MRHRAVILDLGHTVWGWPDDVDAGPVLERSYGAIVARLRDAFPGAPVPDAEALRRAVADALRAEHESFLHRNAELLQSGPWEDGRLEQPRTESLYRALLREVAAVDPDEELLAWIVDTSLSAEIELLQVDPDVTEALETLRQAGVRLGAVTNTYQTERGIRRALRMHGLEPFFGAVVVSADLGFRKPHPSLYRTAAERLGVSPAECLFVGDRVLEDVRGPKAVGMKAALCHRWRQEPPEGAPDHVVMGLADLPAIVLG